MNHTPNRDELEGFSVGLALTPKVQKAWDNILTRTITTKAVIPAPGYYPDFAQPDEKGIAGLKQDYVSDLCLSVADLSRQPVLSQDQRGLLEELLNDPEVLLEHSFADLDRWQNRAQQRLEEFRKLSGELEPAAELYLAEGDEPVQEEE